MLEIADRCNEACVHCYQIHGQKGELTTTEILHVIDQLADMGVLFLTLSGGEPTLRRDFLEIVAHARARDFVVSVYTNALIIDDAMADELRKLGLAEAQVSLYSHRPEAHEAVTALPGSFDRTVSGIRRLVRRGIRVVAKTPLMSVNASALHDYEAFVRELGARPSIGPRLMAREDGRDFPGHLVPTDEQVAAYYASRRTSDTPSPKRPLQSAPCGACGAAGGKVHIEPDGDVRPCTQLDRSLGDAVRDGVQAAWLESEEARSVRGLTWADLHGCRRCDLRHHCSRCYATAVHEGGDGFGPYESACRTALQRYRESHDGSVTLESQEESRVLGPFREERPGRLRYIDDDIHDADRALAARHPWLAPGRAVDGKGPDIVAIRRSRDGSAVGTAVRSAPAAASAKLENLASTNHWRGT